MPSIANEGDLFVADSLSYIRRNFENNADMVRPEQISVIRALEADRATPWTIEELYQKFKYELPNKPQWKLTASQTSQQSLDIIKDGKDDTDTWRMGVNQVPGQWIQVELPQTCLISVVKLSNQNSKNNYPRGYKLEFSLDGQHWEEVDENLKIGTDLSSETLGRPAKFVKITLLNGHADFDWRMNELFIYGSVVGK